MISAAEALHLAKPTKEDIALARKALVKIDQHIRDKMNFAGPEALELRTDEMSYAAAKIVALVMRRDNWNVNAGLGVKQGTLGGSMMIWQLSFSPTIEVYEASLADLDFPSKQHLDA